ncbi:MAG: hypothetical protein WCD72_03600 [Dehalococcoidia bacterium]
MGEIDLSTAIELSSPYPYTLVVTVDKQGKPKRHGRCLVDLHLRAAADDSCLYRSSPVYS